MMPQDPKMGHDCAKYMPDELECGVCGWTKYPADRPTREPKPVQRESIATEPRTEAEWTFPKDEPDELRGWSFCYKHGIAHVIAHGPTEHHAETPCKACDYLDARTWCEDKECFLLEKGVWGHPVGAHEKWAEAAQGTAPLDCRDGHDERMTMDFDGEPIRCIRCNAPSEGAAPRPHRHERDDHIGGYCLEGAAPLDWECGSEQDGHRCSRPVGHKGMHRKRSMVGPTQEALRAAYAAGLGAAPRAEGLTGERLAIELAWAAEETRQRLLVNQEHRDHSAEQSWERMTDFQREQWFLRARGILAEGAAPRAEGLDGIDVPTLREMIGEWIDEGFTTPPYTSEQYDIFEALGIFEPIGLAQYDVRRPSDERVDMRTSPEEQDAYSQENGPQNFLAETPNVERAKRLEESDV